MTQCEFWTTKRCRNFYAIWREDYYKYYCDKHYQWHLHNKARIEKVVSKAGSPEEAKLLVFRDIAKRLGHDTSKIDKDLAELRSKEVKA